MGLGRRAGLAQVALTRLPVSAMLIRRPCVRTGGTPGMPPLTFRRDAGPARRRPLSGRR